ncbi:glycogen debranching protein GlgX [Desulfobulbus alkaliphilus]|uniref:glycogen debranching protein GlgX n=1 Tax=Desulfobulbus alkaliphilus TaxID=869814 RepID=UPI0019653A90|nr:glycogen debranching protein GlgX [Desulfobulbus alkaliphilus]MBM9536890.1 glycogen debranching protein GlgX [Desulfobulbus alkaliphilus]
MKYKPRTEPGSPLPLGSEITPWGINFALFSRHAEAVSLMVLPDPESLELTEFPLDPAVHKTGDIWHILLVNAPATLRYGYSIAGPHDPQGTGHAFDASRILLDPYAKEIHSPHWGGERTCLGREPCCLLDRHDYDWEGDRPLNIPLKDSIIYELHVRGFTRHPSSQTRAPGTFRGITEKISYLKRLGITAVELLPVTEFNENETTFVNPDSGERLKNFWGYSPLSFFAPKSGYSSDPEAPLNEFRDMVKALHRAGIEVILDIVYNHTAEGGADGPTTSFRGIDNTIYYLLDPWTRAYLNFSGCGNTCNCNHPIVRNLIMDALRWWVIEMHVDGFRFDLASILGRDARGEVLANPPVVEMIAEDPVLADTKIIAEAWDAAGLYQVGNFSSHHRWAEWNGRFRDDIRSFMCGHPGMVPALATRIAGSSDLYQINGRRPCNSINFITSHDGFTLADLVSYNEKHNLNNGEENRDGDNHNLSWNSGMEGPTNSSKIQALRSRRIRTMAVILFLSQGVPMLVAGDEFGRSQEGNNNAWCQDNTIGWVDWSLARKNHRLLRFFRKLIQLRTTHPVFRRDDFFASNDRSGVAANPPDIVWQGLHPGEQDWSAQCTTLGFFLSGAHLPEKDDDFMILLNGSADTPATFTIPSPSRNRIWAKIIDTGQRAPLDFVDPGAGDRVQCGSAIKVANMGCVVLQSINIPKG